MQPAIVLLLIVLLGAAKAEAGDPNDYLLRGEREKDSYERAIERILSRGWDNDVVLRFVHIPPFEKELVIGIRRVGISYRAFVLEPSSSIWSEEEKRIERKQPDFSHIRAIYKEQPISKAYVKRCAALWQLVLANPQNYHVDPNSYLDSSQLYFFLKFPQNEQLTAHAIKLGPKSKELIKISDDLSAYVYPAKATEPMMYRWLNESEKKVGVKSSAIPTDTSNKSLEPTAGRRDAQM